MERNRRSVHTQEHEILIDQPIYPQICFGRSSVVDWPLTLDETLAEIIGMIIHNGKVTRDESAILIRNTSKFLNFEERLSVLLKELGIELNTKSRYWGGTFQIQAPKISRSEFTRTFLDMLECSRLDQLLGIERVPNIIKNSPLPVQKAFLVGYMSTCVSSFMYYKKRWYVYVIPYLISFVPDIIKMLKKQSISCIEQGQGFLTDFNLNLKEYAKNETRNVKAKR